MPITPRRPANVSSCRMVAALATSIAALLCAPSARAVTLYWDLNGTTANTAVAVTGAWNGTSVFWNTDSTGAALGTTTATTTNGDDLVFSSNSLYTTGTITASGTRVASSISFEDNIVTTLAGAISVGGTGAKSGIFALSGENSNSTVSGLITLANAPAQFANAGLGVLAFTGGITGAQNLILNNNAAAVNGITISGGALNSTGTLVNSGIGGGGTLVSSNIGATITTVTQNSATSSLSLAGANSYTGATTVTAGTLSFRTTAAKPAGTNVTVAANATLGLGITGAGAFTSADVDSLFSGTLANVTNDAASNVGIDTSGGDASYTSTVGTTRGLVKLGTNVLTLTIGAGTYSGPTQVNAGVLALAGNNNALAGNITVNATGTLRIANDTNFTGGSLILNGNATNAATLDVRNDTPTTISKTLLLSGNIATINVDQTVGGSGANQVHTINNITQSTLLARTLNVTGLNGYGLTIGNLDLCPGNGQATTLTANVNVTLNSVVNPMNNWTGSGNFDTLTLSGTSAASSVLGVIADATGTKTGGGTASATNGGLTKLAKSGTGTWTVGTANTYAGTTTINTGQLNVASLNSVVLGASSSSLGAPTTVGNGTIAMGATTTVGTLNYTGGGETTDRVINLAGTTGGATITQSGGGLLRFTSAFTATGAGVKTLTLNGNTGAGEIAGAIVNSTSATALTKSGTGTWTLSAVNAYTGATAINGGTLVLGALGTAGARLAATDVTVNSTGTLAVQPGVTTASNNLIGGNLTFNAGSAFSMIDSVTNTFAVNGNTNLYAGAAGIAPAYSFDLSGTNGVSDKLTVNGTLSSTNPGAQVTVVPLAPLTVGFSYNVINAGSGLDTAGLTLTNGGRAAFGNQAYALSLANTATATTVTVTASGIASAYFTGSQGSTLNATGAGPVTNWATDITGAADTIVQPSSFTDVFFSATGATVSTIATLGQNYTFNTLNFNDTVNAVSINDTGSNTITLNGGINMSSGALAAVVNVPLVLGAAQTWTNNSANLLTISSPVNLNGFNLITAGTGPTTISAAIGAGGNTLTKTGNGTLTLSGPNTYTGATTISGGTLVLSGSSNATSAININGGTNTTLRVTNAAATGSGIINIQTGATNANLQFYIDGGGTISLPNALSGNSGITTTIDVNNNGSGTNGIITLTGSLAATAIGNVTLNITGGNGYGLRIDNLRNTGGGAGTLLVNPTTASLSLGELTIGTAVAGTYFWGLGGTNTGNTVTGVISNASGTTLSAVTKSNTGTWVLSGANTYTGATTVSGGTLRAGSAVAFANTGTLSMSATGIFDLGGFDAGFTNVAATATTNLITNTGGTDATLNVSVLNTQISALITDGPTKKLAIQISNANSGFNLFKLDSPNTLSGGITLTGGSGSGTRLRIWSGTNGVPATIVNSGAAGAIVSSPFGTGPITLGLNASDKGGIMVNDLSPGSTILNEIIFNTTLGNDNRGIRVENTATGLVFAGKVTANLANAVFTSASAAVVNLTGKVTGPFGLETNNINSSVVLVLNNSADNNDYAGGTLVGYSSPTFISTLALGRSNQIPNGIGKGDVTANGSLKLNGFSETINGLNGASTGVVDSVSGTSTLTIGDNDATGIFAGAVINSGGTLALTKIGTGKETLGGANTYTGDTNVNQGHLQVTGTLTGTIVNVNANASANFEASQTLPALNIGNGAVVTLGTLPPSAPEFGLSAQAVPEPGAGLTLLSGLGMLLGLRRRRA